MKNADELIAGMLVRSYCDRVMSRAVTTAWLLPKRHWYKTSFVEYPTVKKYVYTAFVVTLMILKYKALITTAKSTSQAS